MCISQDNKSTWHRLVPWQLKHMWQFPWSPYRTMSLDPMITNQLRTHTVMCQTWTQMISLWDKVPQNLDKLHEPSQYQSHMFVWLVFISKVCLCVQVDIAQLYKASRWLTKLEQWFTSWKRSTQLGHVVSKTTWLHPSPEWVCYGRLK